jgi:hypothetical protein
VTGNPTSPVSPPFPFDPSRLIQILRYGLDDLTERVHLILDHPINLNPTAHVTSHTESVSASEILPRSLPSQFESNPDSNSTFKFQKVCRTCKIIIKCSAWPKITNLVSLESLKLVESSGTIKSYILWIQFETIFKLGSNLLLACQIHIFCSVHPKITNL